MNRSPRKSAAQWAAVVSEYEAGPENERDFCARLRRAQERKRVGLRANEYLLRQPDIYE